MNGIAHVSGAFRATKHAPGCPKTPTSDETRHPWAATAKSVSVGVKLVQKKDNGMTLHASREQTLLHFCDRGRFTKTGAFA